MHTHLAHLGVALLHEQHQGHQGADELLLHSWGVGRPQLLDHLAIQVDAGRAHVLSRLEQTPRLRQAPSSKRLPGPLSLTWRQAAVLPLILGGPSGHKMHRDGTGRRPSGGADPGASTPLTGA